MRSFGCLQMRYFESLQSRISISAIETGGEKIRLLRKPELSAEASVSHLMPFASMPMLPK